MVYAGRPSLGSLQNGAQEPYSWPEMHAKVVSAAMDGAQVTNNLMIHQRIKVCRENVTLGTGGLVPANIRVPTNDQIVNVKRVTKPCMDLPSLALNEKFCQISINKQGVTNIVILFLIPSVERQRSLIALAPALLLECEDGNKHF